MPAGNTVPEGVSRCCEEPKASYDVLVYSHILTYAPQWLILNRVQVDFKG